jgi:hypothetical protein
MDMSNTWQRSQQARSDALARLGTLGEHFAPMINPLFMGGPEWPSRPGYQAVSLTEGGTALATNGLSDAWEHEPEGVGLGLEMLVGSREAIADVQGSWLLSAVSQLGNVCAGHGGVLGLLDQLGALTVELENDGFPDALVLDNGRVCVLLGTKNPMDEVALPNGPMRYVSATLLCRGDYDAVMQGGDATRQELAASLEWRS